MQALVVYYSLSGTTRSVATALAKELGANVEQIRCSRYSMSPLGFIKAGFDSWANRLPHTGPLLHTSSVYDLVVVGGPMWAFRAATPARAYLRQEAGRFRQVAFFLTMGGSPPEKAFAEMEALAQQAPLATLALSEGDLKAGKLDSAAPAFAARLLARQAA
jgi:Flavodoxin